MNQHAQLRPVEISSVRARAIEDAQQMQASIVDAAKGSGKEPPQYDLMELIGKGSYGRVYKGKDKTTAAVVAIKIIDIDESDTASPRNADSYSEFLKEVGALKILTENKARNINHVIEAFPLGQTMWLITGYCAGGSVATLMKPTSPGGLQEKWIVPILREVAEAITWVHDAGIVHRDIKCANVLVTEQGGVQLCDFGVAGTLTTKLDKRSTFIGTLHWMAPELFSSNPSYGKEVDIWAFGAMAYEIATGYPPNVNLGASYVDVGTHLKNQTPRLPNGIFSEGLRNFVAFCLEELPDSRPSIGQVQKHSYICQSSSRYPTSSLSYLVRAFKIWEDHGGSRKSLFMRGGAQGPSKDSQALSAAEEWNFSTTEAFDQEVLKLTTTQDIYEVYGAAVGVDGLSQEETFRSQLPKRSRRRPPEALARLPVPLEKIFDPNTLSNYEENSRNHYCIPKQPAPSDLLLRDDSTQASIRDTVIDLGDYDTDTGLATFPETKTIRVFRHGNPQEAAEDETFATLRDSSRIARSNAVDTNANRRTQEWKFPTTAPAVLEDPEGLPLNTTRGFPPAIGGSQAQRESLIDLDMSIPDNATTQYHWPPTADSDAETTTSEQMTSSNPFEFERHASLYQAGPFELAGQIDPQVYDSNASSEGPISQPNHSPSSNLGEVSDFAAPQAESSVNVMSKDLLDTVQTLPASGTSRPAPNQPYTLAHLPSLPLPPSAQVLSGISSHHEMKAEFHRMLHTMTAQLEAFRDVYSSSQIADQRHLAQEATNPAGTT